jgi:protein-S-isoprenylcysteine O-methyltransferase Ste14
MNSAVTVALAGGLLAIYSLCALNEEAWLTERYGTRYTDYMDDVPRFLGMRSARRIGEAIRGRL